MTCKKLGGFISSVGLLSTYHRIKRSPKRVVLLSDIIVNAGSKSTKKHLEILIKLGLIEKVKVLQAIGNYRRERTGYKLKEVKNDRI